MKEKIDVFEDFFMTRLDYKGRSYTNRVLLYFHCSTSLNIIRVRRLEKETGFTLGIKVNPLLSEYTKYKFNSLE